MNVQTPPDELAWIGIIGGILGIITSIFSFYFLWKHRERLVFRVITAYRIYEPWRSIDLENVEWPGPPGTKPNIKDGDVRRALIVVEIEFVNKYSGEIVIGRLNIDGWIFGESYIQTLYPLKRDYRVFDLYSRENTGLDRFVKIPSNETYGLRIEIFEDTDGPDWKSSHSRYLVNLSDNYLIEFTFNGRRVRKKIKFKPLQHYYAQGLFILEAAYHWSDDLMGEKSDYFGTFPPQGVSLTMDRSNLITRFRNWLREIKNWLIYGQRFHWPSQQNRLKKFIQKIARKKN